VPPGVEIEEVVFEMIRNTNSAATSDNVVQLWLNGAAIASSIAATTLWNGGEAGATDQHASYRFPTSEMTTYSGSPLLGSDLPNLFLNWEASSGSLTLDYFVAHASWRDSKGTTLTTTVGGHGAGHDFDNEGVTWTIAPATDEPDGITQPRQLYKVTWFATTDGQVLATRTPVAVGLTNVADAAPKLGNIQVTGDHAAGPGRLLHTLSSSGRLLDTQFYAVHGDQEVRINAIQHVQGVYSVLDVVDDDFGDAQFWFERDGIPYPDTVLQSKTGLAIAAQPLQWAEKAIDLANDRIYRFFPNSTNTAVSRQFIPRNLNENPHLTNLGESKESQALYVDMGDIDFGPLEAEKVATQLHLQTRRVDDGTLWGSVIFRATTDGSTPDGTDAINQTWSVAQTDDDFGIYDIPDGVRYRSLRVMLGLSGAATKYAELGPIVLVSSQDWASLEQLTFEVDRESVQRSQYNDGTTVWHGKDAWREYAKATLTRKLTFGREDWFTRWGGWTDSPMTPMPRRGAEEDYAKAAPLLVTFLQVPGAFT
jgi:hypothetical protein